MLRLLTAPAPGLPLREVERIKFTSTVTPLGKAVSSFPVSPSFGKMLALSHQHNLLPLAIALVSSLSVQVRLAAVMYGALYLKYFGFLCGIRFSKLMLNTPWIAYCIQDQWLLASLFYYILCRQNLIWRVKSEEAFWIVLDIWRTKLMNEYFILHIL